MPLKYKIIPQFVDRLRLSIFILFGISMLQGCQDEECNSIAGVWSITTMTVDNRKVDHLLHLNALYFNCADHTARLPGFTYAERDDSAQWKLVKNKEGLNNVLAIKSSLQLYNSRFLLKIAKLPSGQLKLDLKSKTVTISALKVVNGGQSINSYK